MLCILLVIPSLLRPPAQRTWQSRPDTDSKAVHRGTGDARKQRIKKKTIQLIHLGVHPKQITKITIIYATGMFWCLMEAQLRLWWVLQQFAPYILYPCTNSIREDFSTPVLHFYDRLFRLVISPIVHSQTIPSPHAKYLAVLACHKQSKEYLWRNKKAAIRAVMERKLLLDHITKHPSTYVCMYMV